MSQPSDSHLIANEALKLKQLPRQMALSDLSFRIARTFQLIPPMGNPHEFSAELDFNARLVTHCRRQGAIWQQSL